MGSKREYCPYAYDKEWAESLVGLPMSVKGDWWNGEPNKAKFFVGKIVAVNFDSPNAQYFMLVVNEEPGIHYPMRYDDVLLYVDTCNPAFSRQFPKFQLPNKPPPDPTNEVVYVPREKQSSQVDYYSSDDDDIPLEESSMKRAANIPDNAESEQSDPEDGWITGKECSVDDDDDDDINDKDYEDCMTRKTVNDNDSDESASSSDITGANMNMAKKRKAASKKKKVSVVSKNKDSTKTRNWRRNVNGQIISNTTNTKLYYKSEPKDWTKYMEGGNGRPIDPIPYTGAEEFKVKITPEELARLKDKDGNIRYHLVYNWLLPQFNDNNNDGNNGKSFYEFIAARSRSYMTRIIKDGWMPQYYKNGRTITADHIARFFGCQICRALKGNPSVEATWSTREALDEISTCTESMPRAAFTDIYRCLHFVDDWDLGEGDGDDWDNIYADKKYESPPVAKHRRKFGDVEDAFGCRWRACVIPGRRMTFDESRTKGWYHGPITQGPDPKPIRTGATMHTMCVTDGDLATYKLFARTFGGVSDEDLCRDTAHTPGLQKFVNLLDCATKDYQGAGHHLVMDSAYMGDAMGMIGRNVWGVNMVGTAQTNRVGADSVDEVKRLKKQPGSYECVMWQHKTECLTYCAWADNSVVKVLSNWHFPEPLPTIHHVMRRRRDPVSSLRAKEQTPVSTSAQHKEYCGSFHLIYKGNGVEAQYDLCGESHSHGWSTKLVFRLLNMNMNNAYRIYKCLVKAEGHDGLEMDCAVKELAHALSQTGSSMRIRACVHPSPLINVNKLFGFLSGRRIRSDMKRKIGNMSSTASLGKPTSDLCILRRKQNSTQPWRVHQSMAGTERGRCNNTKCPGLLSSNSKRKRSSQTFMKCEECSANQKRPIYLCNECVDRKVRNCHLEYHMENCNKRFGSLQ